MLFRGELSGQLFRHQWLEAGVPPDQIEGLTLEDSRAIKQAVPRLVLTTPEMLHAGILAYHGGWRAFFQDLCYVVLADVHLCVGALGAHMAHLLRRLQRLANHYGAQPQYLLTSAPLANMEEVAGRIGFPMECLAHG